MKNKVVLTVIYEEYVTNGDDPTGTQVKVYKGETETEVMQEIVKAHSYLFEGQEDMNAKELYENLMGVNGDGCDYVVGVYVGEFVDYKPLGFVREEEY